MSQPAIIQLASLAPGSLVAPTGHREACDGLTESLLTRGYAVIETPDPWPGLSAAKHQLGCFWTGDPHEKAAVRPVPREGLGYKELTDKRELFEHRIGPWLRPDPLLAALAAASQELDPIARAVLSALCRSSYIRLPGSALLPALDDLPLAPQTWASSSLQCLHYRPGSSGCEAHEDRSLLTLIHAPGQPGLQVQSAAGLWHFVDLRPNQLLVLAGHALEYATCGLVHSTQHRVVLMGAERQSLAYKLVAQPEATIHLWPVLQAAGHELGMAADRFPQPITYKQIMARFEATHRTINLPAVSLNPPTVPAAAVQLAGPALPATPPQLVAIPAAAVAGAAGKRALPAAGSAASSCGAAGGGVEQPTAKRARQAVVPQPQQSAAAPGTLNIRLRSQDGNEQTYHVSRHTRWSKVQQAYCARIGLKLDQLQFVFEGERFHSGTIEELGLVDGDVVDVFIEQIGD